MSEWKSIESAPKDGTRIVIGHPKWYEMPVAKWAENPGNPVEGEDGGDAWVYGWLIESLHFCQGCEDGFLGWNEDIADGAMPTHWMPLPPKGETNE